MSHHFNVLKRAGLVIARRDGQQLQYALDRAALLAMRVAVGELLSAGAATEVSTMSGRSHFWLR